MAKRELNPKQLHFVSEYLLDLNATRAAERAGYAPRRQSGAQLLTNPAIKAAIEEALAARAERALVTQDMVIQGLLTEARQGDSCSARVSAWGLLGKHLAMFADRVEHSGPDGGALQIELKNYVVQDT